MEEENSKSREVRLGLVLYGGVSLAIYIHGVTQEFFWAVRGRGVYKLLKALTDSDIVVDVISGTSAGGINGIMLSHALCNKLDFSDCASLWLDSGDIQKLLRKPYSLQSEASLLDSEVFYQQELEKGFSSMRPLHDKQDDVSPLRELDLFVTGTNVEGNFYYTFDDAGHPIDIKDHRNVFLLKHRHQRKEQFNLKKDDGTLISALAKLSRITSCFPAAFASVPVGIDPKDREVDKKLMEWGAIKRPAYFLDGGVLDNKPFTSTIHAIFYRLADRPIERKLFYVEPDPERFRPEASPSQPQIVQSVLKAMGIPGYESIADDLKQIGEHNGRVARYQRLVTSITTPREALPADVITFIEQMRQRSEAGKAIKIDMSSTYASSRLVSLSEKVVSRVLHANDSERVLDASMRDLAQQLYKGFDQWPADGSETLHNFDIYFRLRRLFHMLYLPELNDNVAAMNDDDPQRKWAKQAAHAIGRQLKLLEIIRAVMEQLLEEATFLSAEATSEEPARVWGKVNDAMLALLHSDAGAEVLPTGYRDSWQGEEPRDWLNQGALTRCNEDLRKRMTTLLERLNAGHELPSIVNFTSVLEHTDQVEARMLQQLDLMANAHGGFESRLSQAYDDFIYLDAQLFPIELCGDLEAKDLIATVRISPDPSLAKGFSRQQLKDKVSGDVLGHFGAFFKRSWRANDILWGRLDGMGQLIDSLLTPERLCQVLNNESLRRRLRTRLTTGDLTPQIIFPMAGPITHARLSTIYQGLTDELPNEREQYLQPAEFAHFVELIIEAAQLEAIHQEVPGVISAAVSEQIEWNEYRICLNRKTRESLAAYDPEHQCFYHPGETRTDALLTTVAADELANQAVERLTGGGDLALATSPMDTPMGRFFRDKYAVGKESVWKDIPYSVLLKIVSTILLLAVICLPNSCKAKYRDSIRSNRLYRLLKAGLVAFYAFTHWNTQEGGWKKTLLVSTNIVAALFLLVGVIWWHELVQSSTGLMVFILAPILLFAAEIWYRKKR